MRNCFEMNNYLVYIRRILLLLILSVEMSCVQNYNKQSGAIVNNENLLTKNEETFMSNIIQLENIIPLETTDSSLIGRIEKIMKKNNDIYVKSDKNSLLLFHEDGKFQGHIGTLGIGPEEYPMAIDFDVDADNVYVLTVGKIQVYNRTGKFERTIPLNFNVAGFRVLRERILLFVLGDDFVIHLIDKTGNPIETVLKRTQALRLCKAIPFVRYTNDVYLFAQGRSNDVLAYDESTNTFSSMTYLSSSDNLSATEENLLLEEHNGHRDNSIESKTCFDGLSSNGKQILFGAIKGKDDLDLWMKDITSGKSDVYSLLSLKNDLTFTSVNSFFNDNTEGDNGFLSYFVPYYIEEGLSKNESHSNEKNYKILKKILSNINIEEANPIIIEYKFK